MLIYFASEQDEVIGDLGQRRDVQNDDLFRLFLPAQPSDAQGEFLRRSF